MLAIQTALGQIKQLFERRPHVAYKLFHWPASKIRARIDDTGVERDDPTSTCIDCVVPVCVVCCDLFCCLVGCLYVFS